MPDPQPCEQCGSRPSWRVQAIEGYTTMVCSACNGDFLATQIHLRDEKVHAELLAAQSADQAEIARLRQEIREIRDGVERACEAALDLDASVRTLAGEVRRVLKTTRYNALAPSSPSSQEPTRAD